MYQMILSIYTCNATNRGQMASVNFSHYSYLFYCRTHRTHGGSAFIPFCAYKTDLNISENPLTLPGLTVPLCSAFLPTILEGQLCYELKLNQPSGQGRRNQLVLVLDYNKDRSLQITSEEGNAADVRVSKGTMTVNDTVQSGQVKVHIG